MNIPQEQTIHTLRILVPELDELLADFEANKGWLSLNANLINLINQWGLNWHQYYEDEQLLRTLTSMMFFDVDELKEIHEKKKFDYAISKLLEIHKEVDEFNFDEISDPQQLINDLESADEETKQQSLKLIVILILGTLSSLFNYLALMLHGYSMCQLVAKAKDGDDDAFCKAVQVDRTVLVLPYFKQRLLKAQLGKEPEFLKFLAYRIKTPILSGKIRYRTLWLTFAILDDEGLLDKLTHDQIFDICEQVGVYGKKYGIEDVGHLTKRLREYRRAQRNSKIF